MLRIVPIVAVAVLSAGCATTYDEALAPSTAVTTTSVAPTGTTAELLVRLRDEAEALAGVMIDGGDDDDHYDRLALIWQTVRSGVEDERSDLVDGFDRALAMAERAVRFDRAADADRAAKNIDTLVGSYLSA